MYMYTEKSCVWFSLSIPSNNRKEQIDQLLVGFLSLKKKIPKNVRKQPKRKIYQKIYQKT